MRNHQIINAQNPPTQKIKINKHKSKHWLINCNFFLITWVTKVKCLLKASRIFTQKFRRYTTKSPKDWQIARSTVNKYANKTSSNYWTPETANNWHKKMENEYYLPSPRTATPWPVLRSREWFNNPSFMTKT